MSKPTGQLKRLNNITLRRATQFGAAGWFEYQGALAQLGKAAGRELKRRISKQMKRVAAVMRLGGGNFHA